MDEYNTKLSQQEEAEFLRWKAINAPRDSGYDYDLRGAFKAKIQRDERGHSPDTFKKPNHPTFSDQSMYSGKNGAVGGKWVEKDGKMFFIASKYNLKHYTPEQLRDYFKNNEPDVELVLPKSPEEALYGKPKK